MEDTRCVQKPEASSTPRVIPAFVPALLIGPLGNQVGIPTMLCCGLRRVDVDLEDEKIIVLIGPVGSEKVAFVRQIMNNALGRASALNHATHRLTVTRMNLRGVKVALLDTPEIGSFTDGSKITIYHVFRLVRDWCMRSSRFLFLAGILYFQNMDATQPVLPDIQSFSGLCEGINFYSSIVLVATGWSRITGVWWAKLAEYENGLWRDLIRRGARVFPFRNPDLAMDAIALLTDPNMAREGLLQG